MPFVLRRAQFLFEPRSWQVYTYVLMRIGPAGIGWLTLSEMAWDLGFKTANKLKPWVDKLVADGWLLRSRSREREYFLAPDPVEVLRSMKPNLADERIEALDEVLDSLKWPTLA